MKLKKKKESISTSRKLKAAGIKIQSPKNGKYELERTPIQAMGMDKIKSNKNKTLALSEPVLLQMAKDKANGSSDAEIAEKYTVSTKYVGDALRMVYLNSKVGREILKGILLDNAVASGMRVRETIKDLQPMQAVIATGIMTQRFIDLDKHTQSAPPDVDFSELSQMGNLLKDLNASAGLEDDREGTFIDVDGEDTAD